MVSPNVCEKILSIKEGDVSIGILLMRRRIVLAWDHTSLECALLRKEVGMFWERNGRWGRARVPLLER